MILVSANGLGRQYSGDPIFQDLKFEVRAGERIGLVGPNGAGKTTLMRLVSRMDQADYGSLYVRPGVRVSLLRQEPDFGPDETLDLGGSFGAGVAPGRPGGDGGSREGDGRGGRRRRAAPSFSTL